MKSMTTRIAQLITWCFFVAACVSKPSPQYVGIEGQTMGTYYRVTYMDLEGRNYKNSIDSLLIALNLSVSTYIDSATISKVNQADVGMIVVDDHFVQIFNTAQDVFRATEGAFDPTVMPLVNAWGFGYDDTKTIDSLVVDSILQLVNYEHFTLVENAAGVYVQKKKANTQIDFSAIAKGYGVDLIASWLNKQGVENLLVDIGGELLAQGKSNKGIPWTVGIDKPIDTLRTRTLQEVVSLDNQAIATSGNYRNFYLKEGIKYAHTINPQTGYPELTKLLSTSIFADNCTLADAYATACMVLGFDKAKLLIENTPSIEALFISGNEEGGLTVYDTRTSQNN
ncbi:MAG: FAD:protein FMN transferase [Chitinophagales bacterium]